MARSAERSDPGLWERVKAEVTAGEKGGAAGEWSARKAQMAVRAYKAAGGGYVGGKAAETHLAEWTREKWGTASGHDSHETGERYLPEAARAALTPEEYARSSAKKRRDTRAGRQFSAQPADVAAKVAGVRLEGMTVAALRRIAGARGIAGRSRMDKAGLVAALSGG